MFNGHKGKNILNISNKLTSVTIMRLSCKAWMGQWQNVRAQGRFEFKSKSLVSHLKDGLCHSLRVFGKLNNPRAEAHHLLQVWSWESPLGCHSGHLLCHCYRHDFQLLQGVAGVTRVNNDQHPSYQWVGVSFCHSLSSVEVKHCTESYAR